MDPFWIDKYEVTNEQYRICVEADTCRESDYIYDDAFKVENRPIVAVTWQDALDYCSWAGGRLPTEEEWLYAARGPAGTAYPWGEVFVGGKANFCDASCSYGFRHLDKNDGYEKTAPVDSYPDGASWVGALNMAGNVREWVADWYPTSYYSKPPVDSPPVPEESGFRGAWGGSWLNKPTDIRSDSALIVIRQYRSPYIGFRCVVDVDVGS